MKKSLSSVIAIALVVSGGPVLAQALSESQRQNPWFQDGQRHVTALRNLQAGQVQAAGAKNVILFVGDGMGISTLAAARILGGQRAGQTGEEASLSFESFTHSAQVKTYNIDAQVPDSAGTMSAMMSGIKTNAGVVGVTAAVARGNCQLVAGNEMASALELAEIRQMSTGIVTTARVTHATPASTYAKSADRDWEDISDQPQAAVDQGCEDIATQLVNFKSNLEKRFPNASVNGIDVVLGGGRRHFLPANPGSDLFAQFGQNGGDRTDGRNLIAEWLQSYPDGTYISDEAGLDALDTDTAAQVFGLFNSSHMQFEAQRAATPGMEPSLTKMVASAIDVLDNNAEGFLLIVESGRIDHAHHAGNASGALDETLEMSRAVAKALELTNNTDTLIMVTADHSHVLTFAGYPKRGNPILGKVISPNNVTAALAADGLPYTTLGYSNGRGFRNYGNNTSPDRSYNDPVTGGRQNLTDVNTESSGFHQEALVPLTAETHGGEDVAVHATGPGAFRVRGTIEQNLIFHVMDKALGLTQ